MVTLSKHKQGGGWRSRLHGATQTVPAKTEIEALNLKREIMCVQADVGSDTLTEDR